MVRITCTAEKTILLAVWRGDSEKESLPNLEDGGVLLHISCASLVQ